MRSSTISRRPPSGSGWATTRKWSPLARIQSSVMTSSATRNQSRRSAFHAGKSRTSGSRSFSRIRSSRRSNSGLSASHSGSIWAMIANGWLKNDKVAVGIELRDRRRSCGRPARAATRCSGRARSARPRDPGCRSRTRPPRRSAAARRPACSIRRSPPIVAGWVRDIRPCRLRARPSRRRGRRRRPALSISSLPRAMTSAASRASTAATNAELTRPRLRSGPRYHIGNGALRSAGSRRRARLRSAAVGAASLSRSASAPRGVEQPQQQRPGGDTAAAPSPPRTSTARSEPAIRTWRAIGVAADRRRLRRRPSSRRDRPASRPSPSPARSASRRGIAVEAEVALEQAVALDPSRRGGRSAAAPGTERSRDATERAPPSTALARLIRRAGEDHQERRDRHPESGEDDDHGREPRGDRHE